MKTLLGISASPRSSIASGQWLSRRQHELDELCNCDILLLEAIVGAYADDIDVDIINLRDVFETKKISSEELTEKVNTCSGIIVSTPVYFGDRSSWADRFIEHIRTYCMPSTDKIFGMISVGAKRNGGQETTIIFGLLDALNLGFDVIGNGPPTSQFGGTAWGGDKGSAKDDEYGRASSQGLGQRVKRYLEINSSDKAPTDGLTIVVAQSGFSTFNDPEIKEVVTMLNNRNVKTLTLDVDKLNISPCRACQVCPKEKGIEYGCNIIDDMVLMKGLCAVADGIIFMFCKGRRNPLLYEYTYQMFLERTRFIRRDDFILSDIPFGAYSIEKGNINSQYTTRMFTSFLKHNAIIVSPLVQHINDIKIGNVCKLCDNIVSVAAKSKTLRNEAKQEYPYKPIGYGKQ